MAEIEPILERARRALSTGDLGNAEAPCRAAIAAAPLDSRPWRLLSDIELRRGRLAEATACAAEAVSRDPDDPFSRLQQATCLARSGRRREALRAASLGAASARPVAAASDGLGAVFSVLGDQTRALRLFEQAVAAEPGNAGFLFNLATAQRMTGAFEAAEASCDQAIAKNPRDCQAYYLRADLRRQTAADNHIQQMDALLAKGSLPWRGEVLLRYALAKEHEDLAAYGRSFGHLKAGADLQRAHLSYDVLNDVGVIDRIVETHTRRALAATSAGFVDAAPIFIVGLPRTGTTLVERMIASHSAVVSAGELTEFPLLLVRAAAEAGIGAGRDALVPGSLGLDMAALGQAYVDAATPADMGGASAFIDKMPQNYLYCGLIHAALPRARIVLLDRGPMDACYAVYKAHFSGAYPFSFDLRDLGAYYLAYRRLMAHWRSVLPPGVLLTLRYEDLVADQDGEARRLLDFLSLPWEDAVRRFHESDAPATTASAVQVRRPIYTSSIGKWRNYRDQLEPLRRLLSGSVPDAELE